MKKYIIWFLILFMPLKVMGISASSAIAMDLDNGRILYGYNLDTEKLIASTTKIMTAIVAILNGNLDEEVEISDIIYEAYGSALYIEVGEKMTLRDLLYGLMLRSGNDAALAISEIISGSEEEFVYLMNEYANNLGLEHTKFYNPHGLEENNGDANISTVRDLATLTKYAMENKTFREIFKTKKYTVKTNYKTYVWHNKNKLLNEEYITGGKTGFTEKARRTLVSTGSKNDVNIVVVTLNDPNDWSDHKSIYQNIFKNYKSYMVIDKDKLQIKDNLYYNGKYLYVNNDYKMSLAKDELSKVNVNINLMKLEEYADDDIVGYVEVKLDNVIYHKEPIHVKLEEKVKLSFWEKLKGWFKKW